MRIKSIQLKPFAGILDKKVEFSSGLTVILGPNEAGKSTLLNALRSTLFTETELTRSRFDKSMKEYLPVKGGDTIRVSLEFQKEGKDYLLEKIWKPGNKKGSSILKFYDQREYTIDEEVSRQIDRFLPAREGTVKNILLTWQSALDETMNILHENVEIRPDLGAILRSSIMETDGVSVDKLRLRLDREYKDYFQHWDMEKEEPENGRGINHPYKKEVGKILRRHKRQVWKYVKAGKLQSIQFGHRVTRFDQNTVEQFKKDHESWLKKHEADESVILARREREVREEKRKQRDRLAMRGLDKDMKERIKRYRRKVLSGSA